MSGVYPDLDFPSPPEGRPYICLNMVATIDGKIVTGDRTEPVQDLGSPVDHQTMRQIQSAVDGVMIGAGTLRSTPKLWYPADKARFVVTRSGNVDGSIRFFADAPDQAFVIQPESGALAPGLNRLAFGRDAIDWNQVLHHLRSELSISQLLIEGGSDLNSVLLAGDWIDEIFLTVAPKIKLGATTPTIADGEPLPRPGITHWHLVSAIPHSDEVFLRYRRIRSGSG